MTGNTEKKTYLTLGSLFDGSGGFPLAGMLCGVTPVWASEIEPFAIRVTTKRLPQMKHLGDISAINGGEIEPVDIITFGSPCTNLSIAGRREGIQGPQSSLFFQAIRIIREMRCATNGRYPRYIVWENVFGAYSSNRGFDFQKVLEEIIGIVEPETPVPMPEKNQWPHADCYMGDGWSVAYRTLDAQWWGVPQRRRRIYLVADFGGRSAGQILFESEGVSGYSAEGFRAWQRAAGCAADRAGETGRYCLNDQGGSRMDVSEDVAATLRAQEHGHPPCVLESAGFCTEHSSQSRSIGYEEECSPTLRAGVVPAAVALESHPMDGRIKIDESGSLQTLTSRMGTGGMNVPLLLKIRSGCAGGGKGALIQEDVSATLSCNNDQTLFEPICFGISSKQSYAMLSDNPHAGIYEAKTARTLDQGGGNPTRNQGGIAVVESYALQGSMIGRKEENDPQGDGVNEDVSFTLNTVDKHAVAYAMTTGSYMQVTEEKSPTLMSRDYKDPPVVNEVQYAVRRLTPTECAALQGFPRWWCAGLETENPTEDEIEFWTEVFETHRKIAGPSKRARSRNQIIKWLKNPYSEAAEYRLWGNGIALPCPFFVLAGIVTFAQLEAE